MKYLNNAFVQFFEYLHDLVISVVPNQNLSYGIAIILMTIIIRLLILPLGVKQIRSSLIMNKIQPEIKKLQDKYKKDPQKMQKEMTKLYKEKGASPFSGCLPLLIQWPILIALYYVFNHLNGINGIGFLWIKDLGKPDIILALLSGITTFLASWLIMPTDNIEQASQTKKMNIGMSVFMIFISWKLKAALTLYWVVSNLIQVGQNFVIKKIEEKKGY
jgi:YidC/Oxa1 family membrane protein insertase